MMLLQGVGGVFFRAKDAEGLAGWYGDNLGVPFTRYGDTWAWEAPSADLEPSARIATTTFAIFQEDDGHRSAPGAHRTNFRVSDLDAVVSRLVGAGVAVEVLDDDSYGRFARLTDPEGHEIELWEPPMG